MIAHAGKTGDEKCIEINSQIMLIKFSKFQQFLFIFLFFFLFCFSFFFIISRKPSQFSRVCNATNFFSCLFHLLFWAVIFIIFFFQQVFCTSQTKISTFTFFWKRKNDFSCMDQSVFESWENQNNRQKS